ncbi:peptide/nickel transport system ATP-binding protein [Kribbella aluminosa]|uniref:Peptide/nickel transport system ATP-binding protein n=1 Tax=Kribbella aluminosa TaxID=416017 RepID=A0ABS4UJF4_9ACTN|nr:ABC transporter ATP-binding protein [Kribbella aluminosa]MBP2351686.1 peptide/nickel transport system ATP-binding protein [Kribbella aluminosa]
MSSPEPLLSVDKVGVEFRLPGRPVARVLDEVSVTVAAGTVVAVVGESGSGKSTLGRVVTGTLAENGRIADGQVTLGGRTLTGLSERQYRNVRGKEIGYIPQDALLGLNPLMPVGVQAGEPLRAHGLASKADRRERVIDLFAKVGLRNPERLYSRYPHELSGGMCQRVLIAAAMSTGPRLLIADEPTTALDVTVQKTILDLLSSLVEIDDLAILLVTHDLGVAGERADEIAVLKDGRLVRSGRTAEVIADPGDDYTERLLRASSLGFSGVRAANSRLEYSRTVPADSPVVVEAKGITKAFGEVTAVADATFQVRKGTTLGIVGESGSGKTTLVRMLAGLTPADAGAVEIDGRPVVHHRRGAGLAELYRKVQLVYQDPFASLNPRATVRAILDEPLSGHKTGTTAGRSSGSGRSGHRADRIAELLEVTGLPASVADRYTAELSGGQRQRVAIARALAPRPEVLILDEPVSALDVTVQRQILDLLGSLQRELALTYLFISHDLGVIAEVSDEIVVLQQGRIVEHGPALGILTQPRTDYVRELLASIPGAAEPSSALSS